MLAVTCSMGLVVVSPLALPALDGNGENWERIGNIAQAYGAVSALLSGLAVVGVVVSLVLQAREAKAARVQNTRTMHMEFSRLAIENPEYLDCWGGPDASRTVLLRRQHMYVNLVVSHWEMWFELGDLTDHWLASMCDEIFAGEIGRSFWARTREARISTASTRRMKHFNQIIDTRCVAALGIPPRTEPALPDLGVPGVVLPGAADQDQS
ncbi:hypothetical protein D9753_25135 [Streptomyces dangxiongensis]|uniref:Uncharacterized protein n=1 Tax=Streptomyces dangxiongensis TaxID=1442032 RepID=A0A3G2JGS5_9ACTN|nr:DUF6082 family protein [Streptomyces dangxiongensis]AYN41618.1 hypothetical protein D9753_25135 [Streptomyces dangxiongensis]